MYGLTFGCIAVALVASLVYVPLVRAIAVRIGVVDRPDRERKLHRRPIALGGGVAVFAAMVTAFYLVIQLDRADEDWALGVLSSQWHILFYCAAAILAIGLADDVINLRGRQKLLLQCLVVSALVGSGTVIEQINFFGQDVYLGVLGYPVTIVWLLVAINALNLIDGADGMASTAGMIICGGLGLLSLQTGSLMASVVCFSLAGALGGFLVYNRPPASIFLGDAGSMMVGLFVGVLAIWSSVKESAVLASAPVAILAIPLFDSTAAIVRRWLTGRSMYVTDRAHLHHLLQSKFGHIGMLCVVALLCLTTTVLAVLSTTFHTPWLAGLGVVLVGVLLVATRSFGHSETRLLLSRSKHFVHSFLVLPIRCDETSQERVISMQGQGTWETIWEPLTNFAKSHGLSKIAIDLNLAWIQEGYHATWQNVRQPEKALKLTMRIPLFAVRGGDGNSVPIGSLDLSALANDPTVLDRVSEFTNKLTDLLPEMQRIVTELEGIQLKPSSRDSSETTAPVESSTAVVAPN